MSVFLGVGCLVLVGLHNNLPSGGLGGVWGCLVGSLRQRQGCGLALESGMMLFFWQYNHDMLANPCLKRDWCPSAASIGFVLTIGKTQALKLHVLLCCDTNMVCLSILVRRTTGAEA